MITVTINNSESTIIGLDIHQMKELSKVLSYLENPKARYFTGGYSRPKTLMGKNGSFPTGLLYLVHRFLNENNIQYKVNDIRRTPKALEGIFKASIGITPYPEQVEAAEACKRFKRGIVVAPTGIGKSLICALIIDKLKVPTLVVVPSLELKRQLTESLVSIFGPIVGKGKHIHVENVDGLPSKPLETKYDCVIIDEFHHSGAKTYRKLNKKAWGSIYYKFGLTATPFRSADNEKLLLESVISQVIYQVPYAKAIESGYIVPMEAYYVEVPAKKNSYNVWAKAYAELVVNNDKRNQIIANLLKSLEEAGKSTLCLVKEIKHGEKIVELTGGFFAHGDNEDTPGLINLFSSGRLKTLVGTTGVIGEGVDTKAAEYIIIAGLGKSKNAFMQQVGRGFRRSAGKETCKIIIFLDRSHKWTKEHYKTQVKHLADEYGVTPSIIVFD